MRRPLSTAGLMAVAAMLAGCHYASSPLDGFGSFISDTHTLRASGTPNQPPGAAENMTRVEGGGGALEPLLPEAGNIWPGPAKPDPTLADIQRQQNLEQQNQPGLGPLPGQVPPGSAAHPQPRPIERGSSTPPPEQPGSPPILPPTSVPQVPPTAQPPLPPPTITTPQGPQVLDRNGNGVTTSLAPGGGTSIVVPNGNGTSTVIGPDGSTQTVPTPR